MYHMVSEHRPKARFNKLRVRPKAFADQIKWLQKEGFHFVFASELVDHGNLPDRTICLTFDDGYADNLTVADSVLEACGAKATLYLVEDRTGGWSSKKKSHHADDELQQEPKLTDEQVRTMLASGRWELGAHSTSHANLPALGLEEAFSEITEARKRFVATFGVTPTTFAYPFGLYGSRDTGIVGETGYMAAMTTEPGIDSPANWDLLALSRIKVSGKDGLFSFKLRIKSGKRGLCK